MPLYPKHDDVLCGSCAHFRRHYLKYGSRYLPMHLGHCVCLRPKDREEGQSCPNWIPRTSS